MSLAEGRAARDAGITQALENPMLPPWKVVAAGMIDRLISERESFTSEDLRALAGDPPTAAAMGAVFNAAARQGKIRRIGFDQATRTTSHATMIGRWTGKETMDLTDEQINEEVRAHRREKAEAQAALIPPTPTEQPAPTGEHWKCARCSQPIHEALTQPSVDDRYRVGKCPTCKGTAFVRINR